MVLKPDPHGEFNVAVKNQIIYATLCGSFNGEGIELYAKELQKTVNSMHGKAFAMLVDDLQIEGGTPEAYRALQTLNEWMNKQALLAKAFLIDSEIKKDILLENTPALKLQNIEFFVSEKDAASWLQSQLQVNQSQ